MTSWLIDTALFKSLAPGQRRTDSFRPWIETHEDPLFLSAASDQGGNRKRLLKAIAALSRAEGDPSGPSVDVAVPSVETRASTTDCNVLRPRRFNRDVGAARS